MATEEMYGSVVSFSTARSHDSATGATGLSRCGYFARSRRGREGVGDPRIVFWDGGFQFFAGSTGCSGGFYDEDIVAHGSGHSTVTGATMYPSAS